MNLKLDHISDKIPTVEWASLFDHRTGRSQMQESQSAGQMLANIVTGISLAAAGKKVYDWAQEMSDRLALERKVDKLSGLSQDAIGGAKDLVPTARLALIQYLAADEAVMRKLRHNLENSQPGGFWRYRARRAGTAWLPAAAFGAGLMYFLDPHSGNRRRALLADRVTHLFHTTGSSLSKSAEDLGNRYKGMEASKLSLFRRGPVSDEKLEARARSVMGRVVSHPGAIQITAYEGRLTVSGPILASEEERLLTRLAAVRGVKAVESRLEVHDEPDGIAALQGGASRVPDSEFSQQNWTPGVRLLAGLAGGALTITGLRSRKPLGFAGSALGVGLLARGVTNYRMERMVGIGKDKQGVRIHKSIQVDAPIDQVFDFWSHYENFPRFMSNLVEVRNLGNGRSHWVVDGPAGTRFEWDAETTRFEPMRVLAWRSLPGSSVLNTGDVQFREAGTGKTQIDVNMTYRPPAGAAGHVVASLLGDNPKQMMDEDLGRLKSLIEHGAIAGHDATM